MAKGDEIDEVFEIRNYFLLGFYQKCINSTQALNVKSESNKILRDFYMYRAYIAQNKYSLVLNEVHPQNAPPLLRAVRRLAEYMTSGFLVIEEFESELTSCDTKDDNVLLMAAYIYMLEDKIEPALELLHECISLECKAATVQCLLQIDRIDLAIKEVKQLQEIDEDATATQLAMAWVNMCMGKEKLKDAFYIYQEMIDKYGPSPSLLASQASCLIHQQKYTEAERLLLDAQQLDSNYAEAVINLIAVSQFLGKAAEITNRYINQMLDDNPKHRWSISYRMREEQFDRLVYASAG